MKKQIVLYISAVTVIFFSSFAKSEEVDMKQLFTNENLIQYMPDHFVMEGESCQDGFFGTMAGTVIKKDNNLIIEIKKKFSSLKHPDKDQIIKLEEPVVFTWNMTLDKSFRVISSHCNWENTKKLNSIMGYDFIKEKLGWDEKIVKTESKSLEAKYFINKKLQKEQTFDYDYNVLEPDVFPFILRVMLIKNIMSFESKMIVYDNNVNIGARFEAITGKSLSELSPNYPFPKKLKSLLSDNKQFTVYRMQLSSFFIRLFFPHKTYFLFNKTEPYEVLGFWGGDIKEPAYFFNYIGLKLQNP